MSGVVRYTTHGPTATETVETDFEGKAFVITERGAIVTGTITSGVFTADAIGGQPVYRVDRVQKEVDAGLGLLGLTDMQREAFSVDYYLVADRGSTTSAIKVLEPAIANVGTGCGYILEIGDNEPGQPRPPYTVDSITGNDTINLTSAMSEDPPAAGVRMRLIAKRKPLPSTSDFAHPAFGFKIGSDWFVVRPSTREIWRATESGGVLSKVASGSGNCNLVIGATAGNGNVTVNHQPRGNWDFSSATVSGIPVISISGAFAASSLGTVGIDLVGADTGAEALAAIGTIPVASGGTGATTASDARTNLDVFEDVFTTRGDILRAGASGAEERLALGSVGTVLTSDGTDAVWSTPRIVETAIWMSNTATAVGVRTRGYLSSTSFDAGVCVPSGKTFKLWRQSTCVKTGATVGSNYDLEHGVTEGVGFAATQVGTLNNQSNGTSCYLETVASNWNTPLVSIAGPTRISMWWGVVAGSTGALAATQHCTQIAYTVE